ncbi:hypothetical protein VTO73DRAFT_9362 [Trametes versicolor]
MVVYYDVPIPPRVPLHLGLRVKLYTLHNKHRRPSEGTASAPRYIAVEAGVEGTIVDIRTTEATTTELVVRNEDAFADVTHAVLAIQHIEGVTVCLSAWKKLLRATVLRPLTRTRHIPLERDAEVTLRNPGGKTYSVPPLYEATCVEAARGEAARGEAANGEAANGEAANGTYANGEAANGTYANGEAANGTQQMRVRPQPEQELKPEKRG